MEEEVFIKDLFKKAETLNIKISSNQANQFYKYMRIIIRMEWKNEFNRNYKSKRNNIKAFYW